MFVSAIVAGLDGLKQARRRAGGGRPPVPWDPGPMVRTDRPLDLAIDGAGFFVLADQDGQLVYGRVGNFQFDDQGRLLDLWGRVVVGAVGMPEEATQVRIERDGRMAALDGRDIVVARGALRTAVFANPGGLARAEGVAYRPTPASGPPVLDAPGAPGHGAIVSGALQTGGPCFWKAMIDLMDRNEG